MTSRCLLSGFLLLACVAALLWRGTQAVAQDVPAEGEPVLLSGFEEGMAPWTSAYGRQRIDTAVARSGSASLRLDDAGSVETDYLEMKGAAWHLSYWMRTRNVERGPRPWHRAGVQVRYYDAEKSPVGKRHFDIGLTLGTTEWTRHGRTIFFPPKQGVRYIRLALMNWNCTGTTWFDDVLLTVAPLPEAYVKIPPLSVVENDAPRIWPLPAVRPVEAEPHRQSGPPSPAYPIVLREQRMHNTGAPMPDPAVQGVDIDRGYMTRTVARVFGGAGPDGCVYERYDETFRGSGIRSSFPRLWLAGDQAVGMIELTFRIGGPVREVHTFRGNTLTAVSLSEAFTLGPETTKPFVILSDGNQSGLVLFHPIPAEVRRWHIEDYVVETEVWPEISCEPQGPGELLVTYRFKDILRGDGGFCHSFDFYTFSRPYVGGIVSGLRHFQLSGTDLLADELPFSGNEPRGYWQPRMGLASGARLSRMARYFPREFSSWADSSGWDYGHPGGHGWGNTTSTMKGIRVNPNAETDLARDYAWRMLTFFLEAAGETGAPTNMYTWRGMAQHFEDTSQHYATVFCQYWEWRLEEFRRWLAYSRDLTETEKERIYDDLQRARAVYDPRRVDTTWSYPTPNGGLWFEYHDKPRGRRRWVINTHATSVGNAGDFVLLARDRGDEAGAAFWLNLFERGIDGLIYAWEQDDMWTDHDPNEVRYARPPDGGPSGYHRYMVTAWTPKIITLAMQTGDYRLAELLAYLERMAGAEYTRDSDRTRIASLLKAVRARLAEKE